MTNLSVQIISRETVKPSSPNVHNLEPFKISYFDQLTPTTYVPMIFFYTRDGVNPINTFETITRLKKSLSETLDIYYPLAGRIRDNILVDSFHKGVPFLVARVNCRVVEFLRMKETVESLNKFIPCQPFDKEKDMGVPIVAFQVNVFACGGIAIGMCFSHKQIDGTTCGGFFNSWAALSRGSNFDKATYANLGKASMAFPPRNPLPQNYTSLMDTMWFSERKLVTGRFIFDAKSIATLRNKAKSEVDDQALPSRIEAITGFIWKCYMAASRTTLGISKASLLVQAVNLRPRRMSRSLDGAIGNLFWWGAALANPADSELNHLVVKMKEGVTLLDDDYLKSLEGEEGFEVMSNTLDQLEEIISIEKPDVLAFTSWCYLGLYGLNFGFGEPVWVAVMGKAGPEFRNLVVLFETKWGEGVEAWITLDETRMAALEQDPQFLAFASPNPTISSL